MHLELKSGAANVSSRQTIAQGAFLYVYLRMRLLGLPLTNETQRLAYVFEPLDFKPRHRHRLFSFQQTAGMTAVDLIGSILLIALKFNFRKRLKRNALQARVGRAIKRSFWIEIL